MAKPLMDSNIEAAIQELFEKSQPHITEMFKGGSGSDCATALIMNLNNFKDKIRKNHRITLTRLDDNE